MRPGAALAGMLLGVGLRAFAFGLFFAAVFGKAGFFADAVFAFTLAAVVAYHPVVGEHRVVAALSGRRRRRMAE